MKENTLLIWLVALVVLLGVVNIGFAYNNSGLSEDEVRDVVSQEVGSLEIPTAQEIADLVETPNVSIPDVEVPEFNSDEKVDEVWENLYSVEIQELKGHAYNDSLEELEDDNYEFLEDWFLENVENYEEDSIYDVDVDDYEVTVLNLGLEDEEDKSAKVVFELEVDYELDEGPNYGYNKDLVVEAMVTYDEGDFGDEEVTLSIV